MRAVAVRRLLATLLLLGAAGAVLAGARDEWLRARPDYRWAFPRDHWARPGYRTEWWYLTGHLEAADGSGRRFGYQFTLFRIGIVPMPPDSTSAWSAQDLVMGHAALTDLAGQRHVFAELLYRAVPPLGGFGRPLDLLIAWSRAPAGTDGEWTLRWNGAAFDLAAADHARGVALRLATRPLKPLVLQGPNGWTRKGADLDAASLYYSFTRLLTEGTVTIDDMQIPVRGLSWMDKEFGTNQLAAHQVGWDWFSLQLDDGRELMLYLLRDRSGGVDYATGTLVSPSGEAAYLGPDDWALRTTRTWRSPATGAEYPAGWRLALPAHGLRLEVVPLLADQENRSRLVADLFYWEGAVAVEDADGRPLGRGYVELTGYGTATRPAF